jgi:uncharacterized membrane protein YqjE
MDQGTQFLLSVGAAIVGLVLLLALLYTNTLSARPPEVFLAVLLLTGGLISLWRGSKSTKSKTQH